LNLLAWSISIISGWTPLLSASAPPPSPDPMPITMMLPPSPPFQHHKFGWFGQHDEAENEQSLTDGMLDPTDVGNTNMDLRYVLTEWLLPIPKSLQYTKLIEKFIQLAIKQ
jgi:hypothetical protein